MPSITVKNIPENLYQELKRHAEINHRSMNSEVIVCLERRFGCPKVNIEENLAEARKLRELTAHCPISEEELNEAKRMGRP